MGISMMGFLNKFMDTIGVELESSTVAETRKTMGTDWTPGKAGRLLDGSLSSVAPPSADSLGVKLSVLKYAPAALKLDSDWQRGFPNTGPEAAKYLMERSGHDFPLLSRITHKRAIRAITTVLCENLNESTSVVGLKIKTLAGLLYTRTVENEELTNEVCKLALHFGNLQADIDRAKSFAVFETSEAGWASEKEQVVMVMARAAAPSPAQITSDVVEQCRRANLKPAAIVEVVTWISVLQMLHRLTSYYND